MLLLHWGHVFPAKQASQVINQRLLMRYKCTSSAPSMLLFLLLACFHTLGSIMMGGSPVAPIHRWWSLTICPIKRWRWSFASDLQFVWVWKDVWDFLFHERFKQQELAEDRELSLRLATVWLILGLLFVGKSSSTEFYYCLCLSVWYQNHLCRLAIIYLNYPEYVYRIGLPHTPQGTWWLWKGKERERVLIGISDVLGYHLWKT